MESVFKAGRAYKASAVCKSDPMRFVVCVGRSGDEVCFGFCDCLRTVKVKNGFLLDREFVKLRDGESREYNVSAALSVDGLTALELVEMMEAVKHG